MVPVVGKQHVFGQHCARHADPDCFLPQRRGECAQFTGALQRHRPGIESPRKHHRTVERGQHGRISREPRQRLESFPVRA